MNRSMIGKSVVLVLVLALLGMCVVEVVHAAMPSDTPMDCATRLCNGVTGCEPTSAVVLHAVTPLAVVPVTVSASVPSGPVPPAVATRASPTSQHHVRPSAPRSPPLV